MMRSPTRASIGSPRLNGSFELRATRILLERAPTTCGSTAAGVAAGASMALRCPATSAHNRATSPGDSSTRAWPQPGSVDTLEGAPVTGGPQRLLSSSPIATNLTSSSPHAYHSGGSPARTDGQRSPCRPRLMPTRACATSAGRPRARLASTLPWTSGSRSRRPPHRGMLYQSTRKRSRPFASRPTARHPSLAARSNRSDTDFRPGFAESAMVPSTRSGCSAA
mmetsp:Transcript_8842/g.24951  ORF Transcript_8842/g.24951 Transcript_8842/m.24951 type:complete len:223 (+) Transcript_8842:1696-2364(+)